MDTSRMTEYIKVNFPLTEQDYLNGNGEGMWVLVDSETKAEYEKDSAGGTYIGLLDNDSIYYPGLNHGELIPFEMRGQYRPVACFHEFLSELDKLTPEGKELLVQRIVDYQEWYRQISSPSYSRPICCDCQYCGDKYSFPEPNDLLYVDPQNPLLKHFYCCCGDCDLYGTDITGLGLHQCECFEEL